MPTPATSSPSVAAAFTRYRTLLGGDAYFAGGAAAVQVGTKISSLGLALNSRDHPVAYHQTAHVTALRLANVFLHQNVCVQAANSVDHALRRLASFR